MKSLDTSKVHKVLKNNVPGWDMGWCWDIINGAIYQMDNYEDTLRELCDIRRELNECIDALRRNEEAIIK
jgi:hypothetical protein